MKKIRNLIVLILFAFPGHGQVPGGQKTISDNLKDNMRDQALNRMLFNNYWNLSSDLEKVANPRFNFFVYKKDSGTSLIVNSKINFDTALKKDYLIFKDETMEKSDPNRVLKIFPAETLKISRTDRDGHVIDGIPTDTCWLFRTAIGKITPYSFYAFGLNDEMHSQFLGAIQFSGGPITRFDPSLLETIIQEDKDAYKAFKKKDYYKAILLYNKHQTKLNGE
jgi:hypothetical protein